MSVAVRADHRDHRLREDLTRQITELFERSAAVADSYGADFSRLWRLTSQHAQGGKLVRPLLLMKTFDAICQTTGTFDERAPLRAEALRIAAAVEALHFAFLLHDDVIDGDLMRRGRPNLQGELAASAPSGGRTGTARHWAQSAGILAGDIVLSAAHQMFARTTVEAETRIRLLDLLEHTVLETTAGEFIDVGLGDGTIAPDLTTILAMTRQKTAGYTFQLPLRAAVILAGGSPCVESTLSAAGAHLGLAYQLQDDLLSAFGDPSLHGKDAMSDVREGKQTAIMCFARMTSAWPSIEPHFGDPALTAEDAERVRTLLTTCGAEAFVRGLVEEQLAAFYEVLAMGCESDAMPHSVCGVLLDLVADVEGRRS